MSRLNVAIAVVSTVALLSFGRSAAWAATVVKAASAPVTLSVPDGWAELPKTADADPTIALSVASAKGDLGGAVVFEPKKHYDFTLPAYGDAVLKQMAGRSQQMTHTDWKPARVAGKYDGLQCDVHMVRQHLRLAFVVTLFATPDSYDQVLGWSAESGFAASRATLAGLAAGFRQTGPAPKPTAAVGPPVTVKAKDGLEEMVLPAGWEASTEPLSADSQLLAINADEGTFVQLISENRQDLTLNLRQYAGTVLGNMIKRGTNGSHTAWRKLAVNGNDALRCEMKLTIEKAKLSYVVTILQTPDRLEQVLAWSDVTSFNRTRPDLEKLAADLRPSAKDW